MRETLRAKSHEHCRLILASATAFAALSCVAPPVDSTVEEGEETARAPQTLQEVLDANGESVVYEIIREKPRGGG